jgi:predicted nucleic acid-binding Zn ribbon protein
MKKPPSSMKSLGSALETLIDGLGIQGKLREYDAVVFWEKIVGERIAKMTTATKIVQGVLIVQVKTSTWRNELTLRKAEIKQRLNEFAGKEIVKDIRFL